MSRHARTLASNNVEGDGVLPVSRVIKREQRIPGSETFSKIADGYTNRRLHTFFSPFSHYMIKRSLGYILVEPWPLFVVYDNDSLNRKSVFDTRMIDRFFNSN